MANWLSEGSERLTDKELLSLWGRVRHWREMSVKAMHEAARSKSHGQYRDAAGLYKDMSMIVNDVFHEWRSR